MTDEPTTFEQALAIADKFDDYAAKLALRDFMVFCRAGYTVKNAFIAAVERREFEDARMTNFSGRLPHLHFCDCSICKPRQVAAEFNARVARERLTERD